MSAEAAATCTGCRRALPDRAAYCPRCGLAVPVLGDDTEVTFIDQLAVARTEDRAETAGVAGRGEFRRGVAVVLVAVAALAVWALARAPGPDAASDGAGQTSDEAGQTSDGAGLDRADAPVGGVPEGDGGGEGVEGEADSPAVDTGDGADEITFEPRVRPLDAVDIASFTGAGIELYLGDGDDVEHIDLGSGERNRARSIGLPVVVEQDRLVLYRNGELYSLPRDNLAAIPFTLRRVDDPVGVLWATVPGDPPVPVLSRDGTAVWWPTAGNEIRWERIRLIDGELEDEVTLELAIGSPEVASAIGNGVHERVDGAWVKRLDGYIVSAGRGNAIGWECADPGSCRAIVYDTTDWTAVPLDLDPWELGELRLIDGTDRVIGLSPRGIFDLVAGERVLDVTWSGSPSAVGLDEVIAVSHTDGIDVVNLATGETARIDLDGLEPTRVLLVPAAEAG